MHDLGKNHRNDTGKASVQIDRYVCGKIDLLKVSYHLYCFN